MVTKQITDWTKPAEAAIPTLLEVTRDLVTKDEVMSGLKFTPGPWLVHEPNKYTARIVKELSPAHVRIVASIVEIGEESIANGRLISAAPELYEALINTRALLKAFVGPDDAIATATLDQAQAAIVKARGEP
jgi:hypothetical protein